MELRALKEDFDDKTLAPTKILKHKNVHILSTLE